MNNTIKLSEIYRYPIKGLTPENLSETELKTGQTLAYDRCYAIENGPGRFNPLDPQHLPKTNFLMLMRNEKLAALDTKFDPSTHTFTISREGKQVAKSDLTTLHGKQIIEQFFAAFMKDELRGSPKIVSAEGHSFSDVKEKCIHIVNLETVKKLEKDFDKKLDPLRFRANFYIEGIEPWEEFKWLDKTIKIGDANLEIFKRTQRCNATNVDPSTAERDMNIPKSLMRTYNHNDVGVYAMVTKDGKVKKGDEVHLL